MRQSIDESSWDAYGLRFFGTIIVNTNYKIAFFFFTIATLPYLKFFFVFVFVLAKVAMCQLLASTIDYLIYITSCLLGRQKCSLVLDGYQIKMVSLLLNFCSSGEEERLREVGFRGVGRY